MVGMGRKKIKYNEIFFKTNLNQKSLSEIKELITPNENLTQNEDSKLNAIYELLSGTGSFNRI
jgi:hypothetical protein